MAPPGLLDPRSLILLSGDANPELAREIGVELDTEVAGTEVATFADGESRIRIEADVRKATVVLVQPTSPPVNDHLFTLCLLADAARAAGAGEVVAVVPYFGYSRQERRSSMGEPRSAQLAARFLGEAGVSHLLTLDLHEGALESAFPMPTTILEPEKLFLPIIREWAASEVTIVGPDAGGMKRAQRFARALDTDLAGIGKRRDAPDAPTPLHVMGNVDGRHCVVVDDMASTGQTLSSAAQVLTESGAETVDAVFTHAVMAEGALERLAESPLRHLVTSDTIPVSEDARKVVQVVPTSPSLARAILYATGGGEGST